MFELHITQCMRSKGAVDVIISKFNNPKYHQMCTQIKSARFECVNNHKVKCEYKKII